MLHCRTTDKKFGVYLCRSYTVAFKAMHHARKHQMRNSYFDKIFSIGPGAVKHDFRQAPNSIFLSPVARDQHGDIIAMHIFGDDVTGERKVARHEWFIAQRHARQAD